MMIQNYFPSLATTCHTHCSQCQVTTRSKPDHCWRFHQHQQPTSGYLDIHTADCRSLVTGNVHLSRGGGNAVTWSHCPVSPALVLISVWTISKEYIIYNPLKEYFEAKRLKVA